MLNVDHLGQVFTSEKIVASMLKLRQNQGTILEPSCGAGAFFNQIPDCIGLEYDSKVCPAAALNMDFFDYSDNHKFDTIIGNPPYVKYKEIYPATKNKLSMSLFDERSNLYLFFIEKCILHLKDKGELIFIVPRDFIKASSAVKLNKFMYQHGTITHWFDFGDEVLFPGYAPNCAIFRFEKNNFTRKTLVDNQLKDFIEMNGQLIFTSSQYMINFSDLFFVKVGAVSGADQYFINKNGNMDFVCSSTRVSQKTKTMFYNIETPELLAHKDKLLNRKVFKVTEKNWYKWGRGYYQSDLPRIYVNNKTRQKAPFFLHDSKAYDGSVLAVFPKFEANDILLKQICSMLNHVNWNELGFVVGGRYLFNQRSLEQSFLPHDFEILLSLVNKEIDNNIS